MTSYIPVIWPSLGASTLVCKTIQIIIPDVSMLVRAIRKVRFFKFPHFMNMKKKSSIEGVFLNITFILKILLMVVCMLLSFSSEGEII